MVADPRIIGDGHALELLTVDDLAALLQVSKTSVYRLVEQRAVPFYKIGGLLRFHRRDIESYLTAQRVGPANEHAQHV